MGDTGLNYFCFLKDGMAKVVSLLKKGAPTQELQVVFLRVQNRGSSVLRW